VAAARLAGPGTENERPAAEVKSRLDALELVVPVHLEIDDARPDGSGWKINRRPDGVAVHAELHAGW
jgi:hypothetical protein